jgi:cytochrome c oxidase assembly factor CtaG
MRTIVLAAALVALVLVFVPPLLSYGHRYVFVETLQYDLAAFAVPALFVLSWPTRLLRGRLGIRVYDWAVRLNDRRRRHSDTWRTLGFAAVDVAFLVIWRTPPLMDALERHRWLLVVEVLSLVAAGVPLWTELVRCPPLEPRLSHPWRGVVAAVTMWSVWITAYVVGFSHAAWYVAFPHPIGGLSTSADQELSTGAMWFGAAAAFVPLVFSQIMAWLHGGEDPDAELRTMIRRERWWGKPD